MSDPLDTSHEEITPLPSLAVPDDALEEGSAPNSPSRTPSPVRPGTPPLDGDSSSTSKEDSSSSLHRKRNSRSGHIRRAQDVSDDSDFSSKNRPDSSSPVEGKSSDKPVAGKASISKPSASTGASPGVEKNGKPSKRSSNSRLGPSPSSAASISSKRNKSVAPTITASGTKSQVLTIHLGNGQIHSSIFNPDRTLRQVIEKLCEHRSDLDPERSVARDTLGNVLELDALMGDLGVMDVVYGIPESTTDAGEDELKLDVIAGTHALETVHIDLIDEFMQSGQLMSGDVLDSKTEHDSEFTRRKLKDIADKMKGAGLVAKTRRLRLRNYDNCMIATEIVQWTISHLNVPRDVAVTIGRGLQREGFINHVTFRYNFDDSKDLLFRFSDEDGAIQKDAEALPTETPSLLVPQTSRMLPKKMMDDVRHQARCHTVFWNPAGGRVSETKKRKSFKRVILLKTLSSYVPNIVLREFVANPAELQLPFINHFPACVLFADISGFTPLCEACAKQGARGVEVLTSHLNEYFGRMINLILNHGGDIVKFAGDALVAIFPTSDIRGLGYSCLLASQCALAMQEHLHQYEADGCLLTLHIGIGAGEIAGIVVGGVANRVEFLIAGQPMDQVAACEAAAKSGEVFISYEAASLIKQYIDISVDHPSKKGTKKKKVDLTTITPAATPGPDPLIFRLDKVTDPIPLPPSVAIPHFTKMKSLISPFVQPAVLGHLNSGSPDHFLAELRNVSVIFVSLGLQYSVDVIDKLQQCVTVMQECVQFYEGTIRQFIIDDKGSVLIAAFGLPPLSHEDDPCRAIQAAMMLQKRVSELDISTNVGVTTGKAFCGAVGSEERREYAMVGDIVNLSARLMSKADGGILCDRETYAASKSRINFRTLTPITVKGKVAPIDIFSPIGESNARDLSITLPAVSLQRTSGGLHASNNSSGTRRELLRNVGTNRFLTSRSMHSHLVGRGNVLEQLNSLLSWLNDPFTREEPSRFAFIEGAAGVGKSFVLGHFLKSAQKQREVRPLLGSTFSIEATTPYFAWKDIFSSLLELDGVDKESRAAHVTKIMTDRLSTVGASELLEYVPLLKAVASVDLEETNSSRELTGQPRADKLEQLLVKLLESSNCHLVILDNAQWLDSASWRLVLAASQSLKHVAFVLSSRPIDQAPLELEKLLALDKAMQIQLTALSKEESIEIVAQKLGVKSIPTNIGDIITEKGSGNPLMLCELADAMVASGQIEITQSGECRATSKLTRQLSSVGIPNTLRGLITGKVDRLPQNQQMILKTASVFGRIFPLDLLKQVLQVNLKLAYTDDSSWMNDINSLEAMDFISLKSEEPLTYMFQQIMTQEVIYDLMLFAQRRTIHESIARFYEETMLPEDAATFPILAHHYRKANVLDRAVHFFAKSGEQALANYANREAAAFFHDAIELQTTLSPADPTPASSKSVSQSTWFILSWKRQLGQALYNLGLFERAGSVLESALELINEPVRSKVGIELLSKLKAKQTKTMDPTMFKVRSSTGNLLSSTGLLGANPGLSGSADSVKSTGSGSSTPPTINSSPSAGSLKAKGRAASVAALVPPQVLAREHILVLLTLGKVNYYACNLKVMTYCNLSALKRAEELGVSRELCEAYGGSILTCSIHKKYELAEAYFETGFSMASFFSGSDSEPLMNLLQATGMYYTGVQQWQNAEKNFKKVIDIAKTVGNSRRFEESTIFLSISLFLQGKIKESQALTEEAVTSAKRRGDAQSQVLAFTAQARNMLALGQSAKAREALDTIEHLVSKTEGYKLDIASEINFHSLMALLYLVQKDFELAFRTAETIVKLLDETEPTCFFTFPAYMTVPEVFCIVLQEHQKLGSSFKLRGKETPTTVMTKIDKSLKHLSNFSQTFTFAEPRLILWQGVVEQLTSKNTQAQASWKQSLGLAQKYGMLYDQGVALFRIGKLMDVKDKRETVEEKLAAYDAAVDIFTKIGAVYTEILME